MNKKRVVSVFVGIVSNIYIVFLAGCGQKVPEMTLEEIENYRNRGKSEILAKTVSKPYEGQSFTPGVVGGVYYDTISADPKTFNALIAERDGASYGLVSMMNTYLASYDPVKCEWVPHAAFFEIKTHEDRSMDVEFTLRDNLYWTFYGSDRKVPVTSDDIIFWYENVECNEECASSSYTAQFVELDDGTVARITMEKISDKKFVVHLPLEVAEPILMTNRSIYPSFVYRRAYEKNGVQGIKDLYTVAVDPRTIPSCGKYYLTEYTPGQRLVFKRNPYYWEMDSAGTTLPYCEEYIAQIVGDPNTKYLLFKQGKIEVFSPRPTDLNDLVDNQGNDYTVYNSAGSLSAPLWVFNQNPVHKDAPYYQWFCNTKFRQAMSCLLNRDRIISQVYRSLAEPKYTMFPRGNPFYNPDIVLQYRYNVSQALRLLAESGFTRHDDGFMYDSNGVKVEFDLCYQAGSTTSSDIVQIIADECAQVGITVTSRVIDFQRMVEMLTETYDWQSWILALSGSGLFPSQGSNTWLSNGNMHMWYPSQPSPATEWEARIDYLYTKGCHTVDPVQAKPYWDELQSLFLEQCPYIYLVCTKSFVAVRNRWNQNNVYFDNLNGLESSYMYLK
ncbi:MAG: ABC transporter substrate-binding protein [Treponema sp.]|nr:ABC transporter substrate-binding protein [Treponema sp.]